MADDNFDDGSDLDYYHDDPDQEINDKPDRKKNIVIGFCASVVLILSAIFYLPSSIGGRITINTGNTVEFGKATAMTTACSGSTSLFLTPLVAFKNSAGAGSFSFNSYKVENVPNTCRGADITLSIYDNTSSTPLSLFDSRTTPSSISTVYMNNTDTFTAVNSPNFIVTTNSASSFTVSFDEPAALGTDGAKMTLASTKHDGSIGKTFILRDSQNSNNWFDLAFGNGVFVAASRAGQVMSSPNGIAWTSRTSKVTASEGLAFGKGYFILFPMADKSTTKGQYSADGINWTAINTGTCASCVSGVFGGDYFFGVSDSGNSIYSTTGLFWTSAAVSFAKIPRDVCYGGNKFILTSMNQSGGNFQSSASPLGPWVLGTLISTTGNLSWAQRDYIMCAYGGGRYVAVKNDYAWVSANGNSWTQQKRNEGSWSSVAYGNGIFVAISDNNSKVMTSEDGTNWSISDHGLAGTWRKVIFANGKFVMVGDGGKVATSG